MSKITHKLLWFNRYDGILLLFRSFFAAQQVRSGVSMIKFSHARIIHNGRCVHDLYWSIVIQMRCSQINITVNSWRSFVSKPNAFQRKFFKSIAHPCRRRRSILILQSTYNPEASFTCCTRLIDDQRHNHFDDGNFFQSNVYVFFMCKGATLFSC